MENTIQNESEKDLMSGFRGRYESDRLHKNNQVSISAFSQDIVKSQTSSFSKASPPPAFEADGVQSSTKLNQPFLVWRSGKVGTVVMDTPFGFKEI